MSEALQVFPATNTALVAQQHLTKDQVALLKRTFCKGATDDELALFTGFCDSKQLSPLSGQVHAVFRYDRDAGRKVMSIQTGIDGFRIMAQRSPEWDGMDAVVFCGDDGKWTDIWLARTPPLAARATVYRKGKARPSVATAYWQMYVQNKKDGNPNQKWANGGPHMLAKCAESLAIRMEFPIEVGGVYTDEEMGSVIDAEIVEPDSVSAPDTTAFIAELTRTDTMDALRNLHKRAKENLDGDAWRMVDAALRARKVELTKAETETPADELDGPDKVGENWGAGESFLCTDCDTEVDAPDTRCEGCS